MKEGPATLGSSEKEIDIDLDVVFRAMEFGKLLAHFNNLKLLFR